MGTHNPVSKNMWIIWDVKMWLQKRAPWTLKTVKKLGLQELMRAWIKARKVHRWIYLNQWKVVNAHVLQYTWLTLILNSSLPWSLFHNETTLPLCSQIRSNSENLVCSIIWSIWTSRYYLPRTSEQFCVLIAFCVTGNKKRILVLCTWHPGVASVQK